MDETVYYNRTRAAFLWTRLLKTPFWAIHALLPFILYQEIGAKTEHPPLQIALMIALKPMVSLLSMYWSATIAMRRDRLVSNIVWASILSALPFFFFPYIQSSWFVVISFAAYMLFHRGTTPAWMELMRLNAPGISGKKTFAYGSAIAYVGDGILPFLFGPLLDRYFEHWRWLFPIVALLSLIALFFQLRILVKKDAGQETPRLSLDRNQLFESLKKPWRDAYELLLFRRDFCIFQWGFMYGGAGLMLMHAVLPAYFKGVLHLSWTELAVALTFCKGIGFALTSQTWANWMHRCDIYRISGLVTLIACLFPFGLLLANIHLNWIYFAYLIYGVMQAGSELTWNLSGPIFSKGEDSSVYSGVNVLTVGLRGCFAPLLGTLLLYVSSPSAVLILGAVLCLCATQIMLSNSRSHGALLMENND